MSDFQLSVGFQELLLLIIELAVNIVTTYMMCVVHAERVYNR